MRPLNRLLLFTLFVLPVVALTPGRGQTTKRQAAGDAAQSSQADDREKNIQEYITLLRAEVRQQKSEIMGSIMLLSAADAAKFWPIYEEYDKQLNSLNNMRVANIKEFSRVYADLTNEKADELIRNSLTYQKQRNDLLARTYERIRQALGGVTAARFMQVEHQLLLVIDLQIAASLPIAGQGS